MQFKQYGFGLFGWENDDIAIAGGTREQGFHPAGKMRCSFSVYDKAMARRDRVEPPIVATLVLVINLAETDEDEPTVDKFIKVEVSKAVRRSGIGRRIVAAVLEASAGDLEVCDIKRNAKGFWMKMGAEGFNERKGFLNATLRKAPVLEDDAMEAMSPAP